MSEMSRAGEKAAGKVRKRRILKQPPLATGTSAPPTAPPSGRVMLPNFDYLSVAQDIIARSDEAELATLINAIRERQRELGLPEEPLSALPQKRDPASGILERRPHEAANWSSKPAPTPVRTTPRPAVGHTGRYFHHRADGANKTVYFGKTDDPEAKLKEKRPDLLKA